MQNASSLLILTEVITSLMVEYMNNFFIGIIILFLSGIVTAFLPNKLKIKMTSLFSLIASAFVAIPAISVLHNHENIAQVFNFNEIFGTVGFSIDTLSAFFVLVIAVMSPICVIYANGYLKPYIEKGKAISAHLMFLPILIASMLLVVVSDNALMFLICWELMSLSSFFLVMFENEKKETVKAGLKYLVFMHISVIFIILAFVVSAINAQSLEFNSFAQVLKSDVGLANLVFILAFIGFGTKAGFFPFHNWLPEAHPAAPSHVSAVMSAVMIKTGIYGILRVLSMIETPSQAISYTVLVVSLITALYGILYAITQNDVKKLLAYSSIENIGIIGICMGVGMIGLSYQNNLVAILGFAACILHILNHSIFKELMFLAAGSIYIKTHTRNIEVLGGLVKSMPKTAILFLIGSVAICALPPLNGFVSEFLVYFAMLKGLSIDNFGAISTLIFAIAGLALVGTMAILCFTKAFSIIFLGMPRSEQATHVKEDVEMSMILPMSLLVVFALAIGLFPQVVFAFITSPVSVLTGVEIVPLSINEPMAILQQISIFTLCFVGVVALLVGLRLMFGGKVEMHETWGCGYNRPNNFMQYNASSYASPFLTMLRPLFKRVVDIEKPRKLFPKSAHLNMHIDDIEEAYVINPLVKFDEWFLAKFENIQSGNIQSYIRYGLIFLVIIVIGCFIIQ